MTTIPAPTYMTIVETLFQQLDLLLDNYVFHAYNALANYLQKPLALAMTLVIVMLGWSVTQGWVKLSAGHLVKMGIKLGLVYMAAMQWGWFSHYVLALLETSAGQIGKVLLDATPIPLPNFTGLGINGAMQLVLIEFVKIGSWVWDIGSWHNTGPYVSALIIWFFGCAQIVVAVLELALAKIMLAVLLATAPLFFGFTLFKPTQNFFDRWLGACVGFSLLMIFVSSMLALALSVTQWAIGETYLNHALGMTLVGFVPIMMVGALGIGILLKAAQLAQSIGGTVTTNSGASLIAGTVGGMIGSSMNSLKGAKAGARGVGKLVGMGKSMGKSRFNSIRSALRKSKDD